MVLLHLQGVRDPCRTRQGIARLGHCAHELATRKDVHAMMIADITLAAFMFCNSLRFAAYIPQITKAIRDQGGAEAISFGAWSMFLISHASAMAKTLVNNEHWSAGFMFLATIIGCSAILSLRAGSDPTIATGRHPGPRCHCFHNQVQNRSRSS